jgi:cytochrome P450
MQPAFSRQSIDRYAEVMVRRTTAALERWAAASEVEAVPEARRLALGIAVESLFGTEISDREARELGIGIHIASLQFQRRATSNRLGLLLAMLPTLGVLRTRLAVWRLNRLVDRIVEERRRSPVPRDDLMSLLETAADPQTGTMTNRELRDEVNTLLLAGHETTALAMTWALFEIARHPAADARLAAEVDSIVGRERLPAAADFARLPYTLAIVRESLRLYPPIHVAAREALEDVEVGGLALKRGSRVRMNMARQQRDPRAWPDADQFRPERWLDGLDKRVARGSYFPFGMGPRMCIGSTFATMELVLVLATIRQRYRVELTSTEMPRPVPRVGLQPDRPIRFRLVEAG